MLDVLGNDDGDPCSKPDRGCLHWENMHPTIFVFEIISTLIDLQLQRYREIFYCPSIFTLYMLNV